MRNAKQPGAKPVRIVQLRQALLGLQKHFLADIERILAIRNQPQQIIEDALLPTGNKEVIGLYIPFSRLRDQVPIFSLAEDQLIGSVHKDAVVLQKVG